MKTMFRMAIAIAGTAASGAVFAAPAMAAPATVKHGAKHGVKNNAKSKALLSLPIVKDCPSNDADATWVHFYWPASAHHPTPTCVGGLSGGVYYFRGVSGIKFAAICGGENSGWFAPLDSGSAQFGASATEHRLWVPTVSVIIEHNNGMPVFGCPPALDSGLAVRAGAKGAKK